MSHKAGFVNIIESKCWKSTLMNAFVGRLSITSKAQTTRHRILGIVNGGFQMILSDTPGIIQPYEMQESMMNFVEIGF
jgi:GTP-binding protein Era